MKSSKSGTAKAEASSGRQTTTPDNAALMPNCKKTVFTCTLAVAPAYFSLPENSFTRIGSTLISLMWLHDVLDLILQQQQRTRSSSESAVFFYIGNHFNLGQLWNGGSCVTRNRWEEGLARRLSGTEKREGGNEKKWVKRRNNSKVGGRRFFGMATLSTVKVLVRRGAGARRLHGHRYILLYPTPFTASREYLHSTSS